MEEMKHLSPICLDTVRSPDHHEWTPTDFEHFLKELQHIIDSCEGGSPLFRGHADSKWILDSTFVRTCKKLLLNLEPHVRPSQKIRESRAYHEALFSMILLKYRLLVTPSQELMDLERQEGIDPLFELMKRFQQYPEEDETPLKGTFFLDWSQDKDVGLFFANTNLGEHHTRIRSTDGALFICDKTATGKTHQQIRVQEIIDLMVEKNNDRDNDEGFGCPLLFYPPKQILNPRANNQNAAYWAQMDMRYDLEDIWKLQEGTSNNNKYIFVKLILPLKCLKECSEYLKKKQITYEHLFIN